MLLNSSCLPFSSCFFCCTFQSHKRYDVDWFSFRARYRRKMTGKKWQQKLSFFLTTTAFFNRIPVYSFTGIYKYICIQLQCIYCGKYLILVPNHEKNDVSIEIKRSNNNDNCFSACVCVCFCPKYIFKFEFVLHDPMSAVSNYRTGTLRQFSVSNPWFRLPQTILWFYDIFIPYQYFIRQINTFTDSSVCPHTSSPLSSRRIERDPSSSRLRHTSPICVLP